MSRSVLKTPRGGAQSILAPASAPAPARAFGRAALAVPISLSLVGMALRALAVPRSVGDVDSVNFARALEGFDLARQSPHFPGYPIYVLLARAARNAGLDEAVALAAPGILLLPPALVLLYVGLRRHLGAPGAIGATALASIAPGAALAGGWPGSEGTGLCFLFAAFGAFGLAMPVATSDTRARGRAMAGAGLLFGLLLGVRLSWWPLLAGALAIAWAASGVSRSTTATIAAGSSVGVALWAVPMAMFVGPARLAEISTGFIRGHFAGWGGTAFTSPDGLRARTARMAFDVWSAGLGAIWPFPIPLSSGGEVERGVAVAAGAVIAGVVLLALLGLGVSALARVRGPAQGGFLAVVVLAALYGGWVLFAQNVAKPRHVVPLLPLLGAVLGAGIGALNDHRRRAIAGVGAAALFTVTALRAIEQGRPAPAARLAAEIVRAYPTGEVAVFAGEEARVFEHLAPMLRVMRPADARVQNTELERLAALGVPCVVTSGAPGVERIVGLETLASAETLEVIRGHDARLELFRHARKPRIAGLSSEGHR